MGVRYTPRFNPLEIGSTLQIDYGDLAYEMQAAIGFNPLEIGSTLQIPRKS